MSLVTLYGGCGTVRRHRHVLSRSEDGNPRQQTRFAARFEASANELGGVAVTALGQRRHNPTDAYAVILVNLAFIDDPDALRAEFHGQVE